MNDTGPASHREVPVSLSLRDTIRRRGLTAYALARRAGVSVDAIQRFLNGERGLSLATVDKLAAALGLTLCPDEPPRQDHRNPGPTKPPEERPAREVPWESAG